jgi:hypothetical protein
MSSMMTQVREKKSTLAIKSSNVDPSTLPVCKAVTRSALDAIAAMTRVEGIYRGNRSDRSSWVRIQTELLCRGCRMTFYGLPRRETDSSFERHRLLDMTSSEDFRHGLVMMSSLDDAMYWSSSVQVRALLRP